ncbi:hypothetical protein P3T22_004798 [Paraburkholderia sp. GAS348]
MLEASDGVADDTRAATQKRGRSRAADVEYAPCGECALNAGSHGRPEAAWHKLCAFSVAFAKWRVIMRIEFTGRREVVAAARVAFEANVDGADVWCSVSLDALNDHFGNEGPSAHNLVGTFEANRARIENATRRVLEKNGGKSVELESGDFN